MALEHVERIRQQTLAHGGVKRALGQQSNQATVRSLVDLGAEDGRVCIEAAKYHGYKATGIEVRSLPACIRTQLWSIVFLLRTSICIDKIFLICGLL